MCSFTRRILIRLKSYRNSDQDRVDIWKEFAVTEEPLDMEFKSFSRAIVISH